VYNIISYNGITWLYKYLAMIMQEK